MQNEILFFWYKQNQCTILLLRKLTNIILSSQLVINPINNISKKKILLKSNLNCLNKHTVMTTIFLLSETHVQSKNGGYWNENYSNDVCIIFGYHCHFGDCNHLTVNPQKSISRLMYTLGPLICQGVITRLNMVILLNYFLL